MKNREKQYFYTTEAFPKLQFWESYLGFFMKKWALDRFFKSFFQN
jgi:hypothetical protein